MELIKTQKKITQRLAQFRKQGKTIGFVPTMGALHEGHLSLVRDSRRDNDVTVVSIFVNPLQFGPKEDLAKYPKPLRKDLAFLKKEKVDCVFVPSNEEMYAPHFSTIVDSTDTNLTQALCGKFRPGHFRGVLTVVAKLFNVVRPERAYFGAKDYQQAMIIQKMNHDLNFGIEIHVRPTVREADGLAMSSRNQYLSPRERVHAGIIPQVLFQLKRRIEEGESNLPALITAARKKLMECVDSVQYLEIVQADTLLPVKQPGGTMVAALACYLGKTRLIDNVIIQLPKRGSKH